jgi:alkanesulfonate monooxygenase SsuD/methylene tetrahydromethanopterin reductase-like flavin-dependent oxidoreductase (luciferase family)
MAERLPPLFAVNVDPSTTNIQDSYARARLADIGGADMIMVQDHPYLDRFLDTWTLLTALAGITERVRLGTNVSPIALRPPAMLAKAAASLHTLSGGRVELGIGAGAFRQGMEAMGGSMPPQGQMVPAFAEAIQVIRGLLEGSGTFRFEGEHYRLKGTRFGPRPASPIRIWVGATKPRMLRTTGRLADGVLVTNNYVPVEQLAEINRHLDEGAAETGRPPEAVRRGYNLMGIIDLPGLGIDPADARPGTPVLPPEGWIEHIIELARDHRMDTFTIWPLGSHQLEQVQSFVSHIVPVARAELAGAN